MDRLLLYSYEDNQTVLLILLTRGIIEMCIISMDCIGNNFYICNKCASRYTWNVVHAFNGIFKCSTFLASIFYGMMDLVARQDMNCVLWFRHPTSQWGISDSSLNVCCVCSSDIWSLGCVLYEVTTLKHAVSTSWNILLIIRGKS